MQLCIAGVVHDDPLGRCKLIEWLRALSRRGVPDFIATEWDATIFQRVRSQRRWFCEAARQEWPEAPRELIRELSLSLAYEADAHTQVFSGLEILWLDQGRRVERESDVTEFAQARLGTYKSFLGNTGMPPVVSEALALLSREAWRRADAGAAGGIDTARDSRWAQVLLERARRVSSQWAVAVVGQRHSTRDKGHFRRLVEDEGVDCQVDELR
jgi:hypothetical protein